MFSCSSTTTGVHGDATSSSSDIHPDVIQTHILTRLDGPTLASYSCLSSELRSICTDENLWKSLCNSNWPSTNDSRIQEIISTFPAGNRSFFSDSYPTTRRFHYRPKAKPAKEKSIRTSELISAVDIHYGNEIIYSKVDLRASENILFKSSPFRHDILDTKERVMTPVKFNQEELWTSTCMEKNMRLSWILIDPVKKRAVNLSSLRPVEVRHHASTGEILVNYATIIAAGVDGGFVKCGVEVTCERKDGGVLYLRDIGMQVEDIEGNVLSGNDSLEIFLEAMEGKRVKGQIGEEKKMYDMFMYWRDYSISNEVLGKPFQHGIIKA